MSRPASPPRTDDSQSAVENDLPAGVSRRALITNAVLAGTAVVAAPALGRAVAGVTTEQAPVAGQLDEPLVARVTDPRTGVIDIFFGEEHIVLHDRAIAARLAQAVK
jgi:hypothetical protein